MYRAQFSRDQVVRREELITKYVIDYIRDKKENPDLFPYYGLDYCIKWAWPLRFARGNTPNGLKYYSERAYQCVQQGKNVKGLKRDHIVPHKVLMSILLTSNLSLETIRNKLLTFGELCLVTDEEHGRLLSDCMPAGWSETDDPFARYKEANIAVIENRNQWA